MPQLESVIQVLSILILFEGLGIVQQALMERVASSRSSRYDRISRRSAALSASRSRSRAPACGRSSGSNSRSARSLSCSGRSRLGGRGSASRRATRGTAQLLAQRLRRESRRIREPPGRRAPDRHLLGPGGRRVYRLADRLVDVLEVTMRPVGSSRCRPSRASRTTHPASVRSSIAASGSRRTQPFPRC